MHPFFGFIILFGLALCFLLQYMDAKTKAEAIEKIEKLLEKLEEVV